MNVDLIDLKKQIRHEIIYLSGGTGTEITPTHWMPLPPPPKGEK